jgi:signal transduction histidine kinase
MTVLKPVSCAGMVYFVATKGPDSTPAKPKVKRTCGYLPPAIADGNNPREPSGDPLRREHKTHWPRYQRGVPRDHNNELQERSNSKLAIEKHLDSSQFPLRGRQRLYYIHFGNIGRCHFLVGEAVQCQLFKRVWDRTFAPSVPSARRVSAGGAAVVFFLFGMLGAMAAEPKRVLMLQSFGREFAPFSDFSAAFREELVKRLQQPVDLYEASLDLARSPDSRGESPFIDYLNALFAERKLDLVVAVGGPAVRFSQQHRLQLLPSTPFLFSAFEQRLLNESLMSVNDTAVADRIDINLTIENIFRVLPGTANLAVVAGDSPLEKYWVQEMHRVFQPFESKANVIWLNDLPFDEMLKRAAALPPHSAIYYGLYLVDANGVPHEQDRALDRLHSQANAPIFSYLDTYMGRGIVGGPLLSMHAMSRLTAEAAVRVLNGESPGTIKTPALELGTPVFDWRELQRWNISKVRLPPDSIVLFREPDVWKRYRWQIATILGVLLIQCSIISWLVFERSRRQNAELQSRRRLLETIHLNRTAAAGALSTSFAHELNQPLGSILSNAEAAEQLLTLDPPDLGQVKEILADIRQADEHAGQIIRHMRKLVKRREEIELAKFDLNDVIADALRILSPEAKKREIALNAAGIRRSLPVRADPLHLQQVILNIAANGMDAMTETTPNSRKMTIETALTEGAQVEVSIADCGCGIPKEKLESIFATFYTTKQQGTGLGLTIARTIIETYGGKIWAENRAEGGAVFRFRLPLSEPALA